MARPEGGEVSIAGHGMRQEAVGFNVEEPTLTRTRTPGAGHGPV